MSIHLANAAERSDCATWPLSLVQIASVKSAALSATPYTVAGTAGGAASSADIELTFNGAKPGDTIDVCVLGSATNKTSPLLPLSSSSSSGCTIHVHHTLGCYNDSDWKPPATGPVLAAQLQLPAGSLTLETCAAACHAAKWTIGGVEGGTRCFCGHEPDLGTATALARSRGTRPVQRALLIAMGTSFVTPSLQ